MSYVILIKRCLLQSFLALNCLFILGCEQALKEQDPVIAESAAVPSTAEATSASQPVEESVIDPLVALENKLLNDAEQAFRAGDYTTPAHNNAYDKFQSVLLLNSNNSQARAGLQAILLRYTGLIRSALSEGRLSSAGHYISQVEPFYPANSLLMELKKALRDARSRLAKIYAEPVEKPDVNAEEIPLSTVQLNAKASTMVDLLADIANRVKNTDESVMIFARNDREGRWIYGQLKQAASGYRVRGDIRISSKPKIRILPPL